MTLRKKTVIIITVTLAVLLAVLSATSRAVFIGSAERLDKTSVFYFMLTALGVGLVFSALTILLLEKLVLSRLARLSRSISAIGARGDFSGRIEIQGHDELTALATEVNGMLAALDQSRSELHKSEERYRTLVENSPDIIYSLNSAGEIISINQSGLKMMGYGNMDCLTGKYFTDCLHPSDRDQALKMLEKCIASRKRSYKGLKIRLVNNREETIFVEANMIILYNSSGDYEGMFGTIRDITRRLRVEEELNLQKAYFQQLFESSPAGIAILDNDDRFINVNKGFEKLFQYSAEEIIGRRVSDLIVPKNLLEESYAYSSAALTGKIVQRESVRKRKDGSLVDVLILAYPIVIDHKQVGIYGIYSDITERKQAEEKLKYLSLHDPLTEVYNRSYFEQEMKRFQEGRLEQSGIIICDLDGLKFVNDTLGHGTGDVLLVAASRLIREAFRESDMIARIGGDEFAVLLPGSDKKTVEQVCDRIRQAIEAYNRNNPKLPLSISIGYAQGSRKNKSMEEMFKEADNNMYREKLLHSQSTRSSILQALTKALEVRDFMHDGHADRLQELVAKIGKALGLRERNITDLRLLAQFHDIGKVGIPDRILFKTGPLTEEETTEMLRHSEIGHRIAQSAPDLAPVADWILKHHEWWNGKGYPLNLKGEEIPLECRILSIADAYDAMTSDRPYRRARNHEYAINELKKCAGTQFDPYLVKIFIMALEIENIKQN